MIVTTDGLVDKTPGAKAMENVFPIGATPEATAAPGNVKVIISTPNVWTSYVESGAIPMIKFWPLTLQFDDVIRALTFARNPRGFDTRTVDVSDEAIVLGDGVTHFSHALSVKVMYSPVVRMTDSVVVEGDIAVISPGETVIVNDTAAGTVRP